MHLRRVEELPGFLIPEQRIFFKTVPQSHDDVGKFLRPFVTVRMGVMAIQIEIRRVFQLPTSDAIPPGAAAAEMVQRSKHAGHIVRLRIARRAGCHQANL